MMRIQRLSVLIIILMLIYVQADDTDDEGDDEAMMTTMRRRRTTTTLIMMMRMKPSIPVGSGGVVGGKQRGKWGAVSGRVTASLLMNQSGHSPAAARIKSSNSPVGE
jgi:hypothetical protein